MAAQSDSDDASLDERDGNAPRVDLVHEAGNQRYALRIGGQLICVADYRVNGTNISFTRTFTQPTHRGQGLADRLVTFAMDDVESTTDYRVVPMCWYVAKWFDEHPERASLLTR
ncbi:GNAT family N-acetyltransferase [Microbacterium sp. STN6]|uniref:GNAT family N-acetyltransferase n=1 Tax=Microbacterium sp. STN6 TaxID=2995588 RepID=UPI0022609776|nr:GNAT family N-acetyltransferase [Microbacterium sp. STN6]MCX7521768.1 GNAT family N-acetyltransferase [Microbacterium sp. STN6]